MIAPPGYPKTVLTFSESKASKTAFEPLNFCKGDSIVASSALYSLVLSIVFIFTLSYFIFINLSRNLVKRLPQFLHIYTEPHSLLSSLASPSFLFFSEFLHHLLLTYSYY